MKTRWLLGLILFLAPAYPALAQTIEVRVSVKIILSQTGDLPRHPTAQTSGLTDELFKRSQDNANRWMERYSRGYRFKFTEIVQIGGPGQLGINGTTCYGKDDEKAKDNGPSCWYNRGDARDDISFAKAAKNQLELFKVRSNQINFYIATDVAGPAGGGGACSQLENSIGDTICHGFVNEGPWWLVHETGHFFYLSHTHSDSTVGTLPDQPEWSRDQIALNAYNMVYSSLPADKKNLVDDTYFNVMSYHEAATKDQVEDRLTEQQLDKWTDQARLIHPIGFVSGNTHFVSANGSDQAGDGGSAKPYRTVSKAISEANSAGGDIILLRPGIYEAQTLAKPCTLRAPRTGSALLKAPGTP